MSELKDQIASTEPWYRRAHDPRAELRSYIAGQMSKGALYAACVFFGVLLFIALLRLLAGILPDDPYAATEIGRQAGRFRA